MDHERMRGTMRTLSTKSLSTYFEIKHFALLVCHWPCQCPIERTQDTGMASGTRMSKHVLAIAVLAAMFWTTEAGAQEQPAGELVFPTTVAAHEVPLHTLPAEKPKAKQASYWRHAKPMPPVATRRNHAAYGEAKSAPLEQPAWLRPEVETVAATEPIEPPGEAVFIDDEPPSINKVIELAVANVELAPPRATALLVVARELAVEAKTIADFANVIDQCHRAIDANPDKPTALALANLAAWAHNGRGELVAEDGDEHAAFEDFQEAIRLNPNCWPALHNRAVTLARYAKQVEALADFDRVVDLAPDFAVARYNRGELLSELGRWQEAIDDYTAAIEAMPNGAAVYAARGHARHQLGQTAAAASDFNTAIRLDANLASAYLGRGNLYAAEGLYEQASDDLEQALRLDPHSAQAYLCVAWLLSTCPLDEYRSADKAVEAAHRASRLLGEENPTVLDILAVAYAGAGNFDKAIAYQARAIVLATNDDREAYQARLALYRQRKPYRTK